MLHVLYVYTFQPHPTFSAASGIAAVQDRRTRGAWAAAPPPQVGDAVPREEVLELFEQQQAVVEEKRERAVRSGQLRDALMAPLQALQDLTGWRARLEPHDIDVITVRERGRCRRPPGQKWGC